MSQDLREALAEVAERSPAIHVPSGFFDHARRVHFRRRLAGLIAAVAVLSATGLVLSDLRQPRQVAAGRDFDRMPSTLVQPPGWTADVRDAPLQRALAAFDIRFSAEEFAPVTLVGPDDQYRIFDPSDSGGRWDGTMELSPDGRYLMTGHGLRTQVLDVTTGKTRMLDVSAPLAWSPDGRQVVVVRYDGGPNSYPVSGEIRVVDMPSGEIAWTIPLEPGPLPQSIDAALSPNGSTMVVKRHGNLYAYRRGAGVLWSRIADGRGLAGQVAWTPDGKTVALDLDDGLTLVAAGTGQSTRTIAWQRILTEMSEKVQTFGWPAIVAWEGETPIINVSRDIVRLSGTPEILLRAPRSTRDLKVATSRVSWDTREPGPPDPGPVLDRYRPIINITGIVLASLIVVIALMKFRRRWKRW